jgi:hypothetical protein
MAKKKTPAQLDREIAQSIMFAGAATPHSAKALATLAGMGTTPTQWQLTPIEWIVLCGPGNGSGTPAPADRSRMYGAPQQIGRRNGREDRHLIKLETVRTVAGSRPCPPPSWAGC